MSERDTLTRVRTQLAACYRLVRRCLDDDKLQTAEVRMLAGAAAAVARMAAQDLSEIERGR